MGNVKSEDFVNVSVQTSNSFTVMSSHTTLMISFFDANFHPFDNKFGTRVHQYNYGKHVMSKVAIPQHARYMTVGLGVQYYGLERDSFLLDDLQVWRYQKK